VYIVQVSRTRHTPYTPPRCPTRVTSAFAPLARCLKADDGDGDGDDDEDREGKGGGVGGYEGVGHTLTPIRPRFDVPHVSKRAL
jgi:hypothetical protein